MTVTYEIDRKEFEKFLSENPQRVFKQNLPSQCSLAQYLASVGLENPACQHNTAFIGPWEYRATIDLPAWASSVSSMHHAETVDKILDPEPFTGKEILDFLATIAEEE